MVLHKYPKKGHYNEFSITEIRNNLVWDSLGLGEIKLQPQLSIRSSVGTLFFLEQISWEKQEQRSKWKLDQTIIFWNLIPDWTLSTKPSCTQLHGYGTPSSHLTKAVHLPGQEIPAMGYAIVGPL